MLHMLLSACEGPEAETHLISSVNVAAVNVLGIYWVFTQNQTILEWM